MVKSLMATIFYHGGNAKREEHDYQGALRAYEQALALNPASIHAWINLGVTYYALLEHEKSLDAYRHALDLKPNDRQRAQIIYNQATILMALGHHLEALEEFNASIMLKPFAWSHGQRGHLHSLLGNQQEALADYERAYELAPHDINVVWTRTWAHFGKEEEVYDLLPIALLDQDHYVSKLCLGVMAMQRRDHAAALVHFLSAVEQAPDQFDSHFWLGMWYAFLHEDEMAKEEIDTAYHLWVPPILLKPLYWLQDRCPALFQEYQGLLQHFGVER